MNTATPLRIDGNGDQSHLKDETKKQCSFLTTALT